MSVLYDGIRELQARRLAAVHQAQQLAAVPESRPLGSAVSTLRAGAFFWSDNLRLSRPGSEFFWRRYIFIGGILLAVFSGVAVVYLALHEKLRDGQLAEVANNAVSQSEIYGQSASSALSGAATVRGAPPPLTVPKVPETSSHGTSSNESVAALEPSESLPSMPSLDDSRLSAVTSPPPRDSQPAHLTTGAPVADSPAALARNAPMAGLAPDAGSPPTLAPLARKAPDLPSGQPPLGFLPSQRLFKARAPGGAITQREVSNPKQETLKITSKFSPKLVAKRSDEGTPKHSPQLLAESLAEGMPKRSPRLLAKNLAEGMPKPSPQLLAKSSADQNVAAGGRRIAAKEVMPARSSRPESGRRADPLQTSLPAPVVGKMDEAMFPASLGMLHAAIAAGNAPEVERTLSGLAVVMGEGSLFVLKMRGFWLLKQGKLDAANEMFSRVLHIKPQDIEAQLNMAVIEMRSGQQEAGLASLSRLSERYPMDERVQTMIKQFKSP